MYVQDGRYLLICLLVAVDVRCGCRQIHYTSLLHSSRFSLTARRAWSPGLFLGSPWRSDIRPVSTADCAGLRRRHSQRCGVSLGDTARRLSRLWRNVLAINLPRLLCTVCFAVTGRLFSHRRAASSAGHDCSSLHVTVSALETSRCRPRLICSSSCQLLWLWWHLVNNHENISLRTVHMCVRISLCTTVVNNTAQNSSDYFPS